MIISNSAIYTRIKRIIDICFFSKWFLLIIWRDYTVSVAYLTFYMYIYIYTLITCIIRVTGLVSKTNTKNTVDMRSFFVIFLVGYTNGILRHPSSRLCRIIISFFGWVSFLRWARLLIRDFYESSSQPLAHYNADISMLQLGTDSI
jgi:hypothetical protein